MGIPSFGSEGFLPEGIHLCSGQEFLDRFSSSASREKFGKPICDILDFAKVRGAVYLFVGGSFVSNSNEPNDFDCVLVFREDSYIPRRTEKVSLSGMKFDILYASLESRNTVDSYLKLFSSGRFGLQKIGVVQIDLYDKKATWEIRHQPDDDTLEIIKRAYNDRSLIDLNERVGTLVSIHGLSSRAEWNKEISPVASSQGWVFAPYIYERNQPDLLFKSKLRSKIVDDFRDWIYEIHARFPGGISVVAHSFGTFIIGSYLEGFDDKALPPVSFESIILTGSILSTDFDWEKHRGRGVGAVLNMVAPNDEYIKFMPDKDISRLIGMSKLFGRSGVAGFTSESPIVFESKNEIFTHTNTIRRDVIETKWMPFLNSKTNSMWSEYIQKNLPKPSSTTN